MKKKISKSFERLKKNYPDLDDSEKKIRGLSPSQISKFKSLQDSYDLSLIQNDDLKLSQKEITEDLSESAKQTHERIKKGLPFKV